MAVTVTVVLQRPTLVVADVEATADGDTTAVVAHGLDEAPVDLSLVNLQTVAGLAAAWAVTGVDATNVTLTKIAAVGSGAAGNQVRLTAAIPHSIV